MHIGSYMFGVEWNVEQPTFQSAKNMLNWFIRTVNKVLDIEFFKNHTEHRVHKNVKRLIFRYILFLYLRTKENEKTQN